MKRLTIRNSDGSVSQPTDLKWAEALEKLAAYEDTGLEPEEVRSVKWIPVTERLPDDRNYVLACFYDIQVIAYYYDSMWCEAITHAVFYPTHWMPLPEQPEGGADG